MIPIKNKPKIRSHNLRLFFFLENSTLDCPIGHTPLCVLEISPYTFVYHFFRPLETES